MERRTLVSLELQLQKMLFHAEKLLRKESDRSSLGYMGFWLHQQTLLLAHLVLGIGICQNRQSIHHNIFGYPVRRIETRVERLESPRGLSNKKSQCTMVKYLFIGGAVAVMPTIYASAVNLRKRHITPRPQNDRQNNIVPRKVARLGVSSIAPGVKQRSMVGMSMAITSTEKLSDEARTASQPSKSPAMAAELTKFSASLTSSPTTSVALPNRLPALSFKGDGLPPNSYARCEGDCDTDDDCIGDGLVCYQRSSYEPVPSCDGTGLEGMDYCVARPQNYLTFIGDSLGQGAYGLCEGDCDADDDCAGEFICQQRDDWEEVWGCVGYGTYSYDYCRELTQEEAAFIKQPSSSPAGEPLAEYESTSIPSASPSQEAARNNPTTRSAASLSPAPTSDEPTQFPSAGPSHSPTTDEPTTEPSSKPSGKPSASPNEVPSLIPSAKPSLLPSASPSLKPSTSPSGFPSLNIKAKNSKLIVETNNVQAAAFPPLSYKGNSLPPASYAECEGDCDTDDDCDDNLFCFQRAAFEPIPGCEGTGYRGVDYCARQASFSPEKST